jgi:hypothetical protein
MSENQPTVGIERIASADVDEVLPAKRGSMATTTCTECWNPTPVCWMVGSICRTCQEAH